MRPHIAPSIGWIALAALLQSTPAHAGAFEVAPTTISLPSEAFSGTLYVTNRGDRTVNAQIEAVEWKQNTSGESLTPTETLMVSPPMVRLAPGQKQTIRLAVEPAPESRAERSFRLLVSELPDHSDKQTDTVQVLLQFSVPVFIDAPAKSTPDIHWHLLRDTTGTWLTAENKGAVHAKLSGLTLQPEKGDSTKIAGGEFFYLLAQSSKRWKLEKRFTDSPIELTAEDEKHGPIRTTISTTSTP